LPWTIELLPEAAKELKALDRAVARRIVAVLETRIAVLDDPRVIGAPLAGEWSGHWRWRVGDYRLIGRVEQARVVIMIVRVAHRPQAARLSAKR
jgi:mRNA interferase RelE/StbE